MGGLWARAWQDQHSLPGWLQSVCAKAGNLLLLHELGAHLRVPFVKMNNIPPPLPSRKTFFHRAALVSLYSPLATWLLGIVVNVLILTGRLEQQSAHVAHQIVGRIAFVLFPTGFISGIVALFGMKR